MICRSPCALVNCCQQQRDRTLLYHHRPRLTTSLPTTARRSLSSTAAAGGRSAGDLSALLARVAAGDLSPGTAASQLAPLLVSGGAQAEDVGGFAKIDHDRRRRVGFPEVVFGDGKSAEQIADIFSAMIQEAGADTSRSPIVATRVSPEKWSVISEVLPGQLTYHADARILSFGEPPEHRRATVGGDLGGSIATSIGRVAVLSAGTSDLAVAEEAAVLAELAGAEVRSISIVIPYADLCQSYVGFSFRWSS